jgi:hypothetical protein
MKLFIFLVVISLAPLGLFSNDGSLKQNPNVLLNPQDLPIFYDNSPLTGLKAFTVIFSFSEKDAKMQKRIQQSIENTLKEVGEVLYLKDKDMRGFGAGNILLIQMGDVIGWDGGKIAASRLSLNVETSVTLEKTGIKTLPMIWSINTFLQGNIASNSESNLLKAAQKLMRDFIQSYQYVNKDQTKKPLFYVYD